MTVPGTDKALPRSWPLHNETARGYLLIGVIFVHCLYDLTDNATPASAPLTFALIKLLSPHVGLFFFLSGLGSQGIGLRTAITVIQKALMLIFLSWISHAAGVSMQDLLLNGTPGGLSFIKEVMKPIIYGTGSATFITWFLITLAVARCLVWIFARDWRIFFLTCIALTGLIELSRALHLPDNLYEWRHWPLATLFMLAGVYFPKNISLRFSTGLICLSISLALTWLNHPGLLDGSSCVFCDTEFAAEPKIGFTGPLPIFILSDIFFGLALLTVAQFDQPVFLIKTARFFGRSSLQILLINGWVLTSIQPFLSNYFPTNQGILVVFAALILAPLLHAVLFIIFKRQINNIIAFCFQMSRAVIRYVERIIEIPLNVAKHVDVRHD